MPYHVMYPNVTRLGVELERLVVACHVMPYHVIYCNVTRLGVELERLVVSCHAMPYHAMYCNVTRLGVELERLVAAPRRAVGDAREQRDAVRPEHRACTRWYNNTGRVSRRGHDKLTHSPGAKREGRQDKERRRKREEVRDNSPQPERERNVRHDAHPDLELVPPPQRAQERDVAEHVPRGWAAHEDASNNVFQPFVANAGDTPR